MSEIDEVLAAATRLRDAGEPVGLATVVSVRGSSYRRPGARLLVPRDSPPVGLISGGCLEDEAARLARQAIADDAPLLVTIDHSNEGDELWGSGLGCRGVIELLAEPPPLATETLEALRAARTEGRATYQLTGLDGERRHLTAIEADALGERAALAVAHGRPALIGETVLDPILPPLHLVVCGAGPDAAPLVAAGVRQGWRVDVVDPRRSWLRADRFPGARLLDAEPAQAAEAAGAGEWTAVVIMSHDYLRDAAFLGGFLGRGVTYLGILGPRDRTERLLAELPSPPSDADRAVLHAPAGLDLGADGAEQVATSIVAEILAVLHGRSGGHLREQSGPIHG
ncbi:MAG TPA: XdhC family protein [Candidatus Limnocylindrales bacterium]|nr:XdhC family protein [Candidatus Limnocylindrales bacterium]